MTEQLGSTGMPVSPESEIPEPQMQTPETKLQILKDEFFRVLRRLNSTAERPLPEEIENLKSQFTEIIQSIASNDDNDQIKGLKSDLSALFCGMLDAYYDRNRIANFDSTIRNSLILETGASVLAGVLTNNSNVFIQLTAVVVVCFLTFFLPRISGVLGGIVSNNSGSDRPDDQSSQDPNSLDRIIRTIGAVDITTTEEQASVLMEIINSIYYRLNSANINIRLSEVEVKVLLELTGFTSTLSSSAIAFDQSTPAHPNRYALQRLLGTLLISISVALGLRGCTAISDSQQLSSSQGARQTPAATVIIDHNPPPISITSPVSRPTATPYNDEQQIFDDVINILKDKDPDQLISLINELKQILVEIKRRMPSLFPEP